MDLLDLMAVGDDLREKALERLEGIVALYQSDDEDVQDEALARAISLCGKEWGGYRDGLEALAKRKEEGEADPLSGEMEALRLREEAAEPGSIIKSVRECRRQAGRLNDERAAVIARYGSLEAALAPSPVERIFIDAASGLAAGDDDAWAPLAGWSVPWHDVPEALALVVARACPLPGTLTDARDEALTWEERRREREILGEGPGHAMLPTACAARHRLVDDLWRRGLPVRNAQEMQARLDYWAERGGDDGLGYAVLRADFQSLAANGALSRGGESTKDKIRSLKRQHPDWSLARIGKELGISRQAVHKHLKF